MLKKAKVNLKVLSNASDNICLNRSGCLESVARVIFLLSILSSIFSLSGDMLEKTWLVMR